MKFVKKYIKSKLINLHNYLLDEDSKNLERGLQRITLKETAEFILQEGLIKVPAFSNKFDLLKYAISNIEVEGLILEFGVYKGETINFIANLLTDKTIYGFDSFEGLPETWRFGFEKGVFALSKLPKVRNNVQLIKGWFEETLPAFSNQIANTPIAFLHIDCDLYSSTKVIFKFLGKNIVAGTIIVFDEFFNYPGWKDGEFKAFYEFVKEKNIEFEWLGFVKYHEQVGVKIKNV